MSRIIKINNKFHLNKKNMKNTYATPFIDSMKKLEDKDKLYSIMFHLINQAQKHDDYDAIKWNEFMKLIYNLLE